ncbi:hypothetical protein LCGC14_1487290 [marine sediment metagenome]|uniref:Uncharacterized protein n=1 Tax=marine sediment metagenome TaxID=412755 RepID=A0A0F9J7T7_9ZZZZ
MTLLSFLGFMAVVLTVAMFATRQSMLGFPSAIFWAITGAQAYTLSTVPWGDIYYYIAFASLLGMTSFTALGAFGLREKRDTLADEGMDDDSKVKDDSFIDEHEKEADTDYWSGKDGETPPSERSAAVRERAARRRSGTSRRKKTSFGEFK